MMRMNKLQRDIYRRRGAIYKPGANPINALEKRVCKPRPYDGKGWPDFFVHQIDRRLCRSIWPL